KPKRKRARCGNGPSKISFLPVQVALLPNANTRHLFTLVALCSMIAIDGGLTHPPQPVRSISSWFISFRDWFDSLAIGFAKPLVSQPSSRKSHLRRGRLPFWQIDSHCLIFGCSLPTSWSALLTSVGA